METKVHHVQLVPGAREHKPGPPRKATITVTCMLNQAQEVTFDVTPNHGDVELAFNLNPEDLNLLTILLVDNTQLGIKFVEDDLEPFFVKSKPPDAPDGTLLARRVSDTKLKVYNENGSDTPHPGVWWEFRYGLRLEGPDGQYLIDPIVDDEPGP